MTFDDGQPNCEDYQLVSLDVNEITFAADINITSGEYFFSCDEGHNHHDKTLVVQIMDAEGRIQTFMVIPGSPMHRLLTTPDAWNTALAHANRHLHDT